MGKKTENRTCQCCGGEFLAEERRVLKGLAKFCSPQCAAKSRPKKHGHTTHNSQSRTYTTYCNMIGRCHRDGHAKFARYGAVGISVCDRWRESFENFLQDMGERPEGTTIDRINGELGYFKENCRWATPVTQQGNIKTNVNVVFMGRTQNISAWADELGIANSVLAWRIRTGWSVEEALTTNPKLGNRTKKTGQVLYEFNGKTLCVSEWAREYGLSIALLRHRLGKGWDIEKSLTEPKGHFVKKGDHLTNPS